VKKKKERETDEEKEAAEYVQTRILTPVIVNGTCKVRQAARMTARHLQTTYRQTTAIPP
jgi:hypothetical protein